MLSCDKNDKNAELQCCPSPINLIFVGLCMQDGDLDIEEDSKPIIKVKKESNAELVIDKPTKSDDHPLIPKDEKLNGVQIVSNGNAKHNNNSDKQ